MKGLIFTFALTYGGAAASLVRPWYGFLIYVCFAIVKPEAKWGFALPNLRYSLTIAVALLVGWALAGFGNWNFGRARAVVYSLLGFWAWLVVASVMAPNQDVAWLRTENLTKIFLPFIVGVTLVDSVEKLKQLAWVIIVSQGYLAFEFNVQYYTTGFPWGLRYGGQDNNGVALSMVTAIGVAFFVGLQAERWWAKCLALGLAALMAHVVLFSDSRGGMVALCVTGLATFLLLPKRPVHYLAFALAVALVLRLAGEGVRERFATIFVDAESRDASSVERVELWKACASSMLAQPLGLGPAHWRLNVHRFGFKEGKAAHTTWLEVGAELGIPGFVLLLSFYLVGAWRLWLLTRNNLPVNDPWLTHFARMILGSIAGFVVAAQFLSVPGVELPYYLYVLASGTLMLSTSPSPAAVTRAVYPYGAPRAPRYSS